jgi:hypothetical protein
VIVGADSTTRAFEDLRGARCAINGLDSQSGCNALRSLVATASKAGRFFRSVAISGGHQASLALVAARQADVAAIDCVTHTVLARHRPQAQRHARVSVVLPRRPACPTSREPVPGGPAPAPARRPERALLIPNRGGSGRLVAGRGSCRLAAYDRIGELEDAAIAAGYPEIA